MSPEIPLRFHYDQPQRPEINPAWLHRLAEAANTVGGLRIIAEPEAANTLQREAALVGARS